MGAGVTTPAIFFRVPLNKNNSRLFIIVIWLTCFFPFAEQFPEEEC